MCADKGSATLGGCAAAASSRQGCRGAAMGERARRLRHLQARIRPRQKCTDPHFFQIYEEANALDLPLCIHTGHPLPGHEWDRGFPIMYSFTSMVSSGLAAKFPKLRFGLIESGASWIPYTISQLG